MKNPIPPLFLYLILSPIVTAAQAPVENPVHWSAQPVTKVVHPGEIVEVKLEASIDGEWHMYSATQPAGGPNPTRFNLLSGEPFTISETR